MNSIIQHGKYCWLCGANGNGEPLDKHHVFGGANRSRSEKYGLTVWLCHGKCHIFGENAAHRSRESRERLQEAGQRAAMECYGWDAEQFRIEFGKSYLDEEPERAKPKKSGFRILDSELCVGW